MSAAHRESRPEQAPGEVVAVSESLPRVVIADDHDITRRGVRMALSAAGFTVVAEAADCDGAVRAVIAERPDLCLLDISMPGSGLAAARKISRAVPEAAIVMLTVSDATEDVLAALRAGAMGYLSKDTPPGRLAATLRGVLQGEAALPRALMGRVLSELHGVNGGGTGVLRVGAVELSSRESEILRLLRTGRGTMEIGELLGLSPITVRRHISSGVAKLGVADRAAALRAIEPRPAA